MKKKFSLGLDLGITSIGWALMEMDEENNFKRIADVGVRLFNPIEDKDGNTLNSVRRVKRGQRRLRRRRRTRLDDLIEYFKKEWNMDFLTIRNNLHNYDSPYEIKVRGLNEELTREELSIALYHYCKRRGYKSNRKAATENKNAKEQKEEGKVLDGIKKVSKIMGDEGITPTEYIVRKYKEIGKMRNSDDIYEFAFTREMYEDEINKLLEKQIEFGVINEEFKEEYMDKYWGRQRSFSMGPNHYSPYSAGKGKSLIEKMIGVCKFDERPRAPKGSFSAESFVFLSGLANLRYTSDGNKGEQSLTKEEVNNLYEAALNLKQVKYSHIVKEINKENVKIKGLEFSRKEYVDKVKKFKSANNIPMEDFISSNDERLSGYLKKELENKVFGSLTNFQSQKKIIENSKSKNKDKFLSDLNNFDKIAELLLRYKTDDEIRREIKKNTDTYPFDDEIIESILQMNSIDKTINLSVDLCQKLIPHLKEGLDYSKSLEKLGYKSYEPNKIKERKYLPSIDTIIDELGLNMTNPNVMHMLRQARVLINEIIKEYGKPNIINIELARELSLDNKGRMKLTADMNDSAYNNTRLRHEIVEKFKDTFRGIDSVSNDDLTRYKLYKEQGGYCPYSQQRIDEGKIFSHCEVDHILPYSRTFNDSHNNKALVYARENQNKGNSTPYEHFKGEDWKKFEEFINSKLHRIPNKKKSFYLAKEISEDFKERNLNDTRYASRELRNIIEAYLKPEEIRACHGPVTSKLRSLWGLYNMEHSLINQDMRRKQTYIFDTNQDYYRIEKDEKEENLEIKLLVQETREKLKFTFKKIKPTAKKDLTDNERRYNQLIDYAKSMNTKTKEFFMSGGNFSVYQAYSNAFEKLKEVRDESNLFDFYSYLVDILWRVIVEIRKKEAKKNRGNHLHHAVDAIVIACSTKANFDKITKDNKRFEREKRGDRSITSRNHNSNLVVELPYDEFQEDVRNRVYQRDFEKLKEKALSMDCYKDIDEQQLNNLSVIYPSRSPKIKTNGALHKETIYGEKNGVIFKRMSTRNLKEKDIENILYFGKEEHREKDPIIVAIREWMKTSAEERKKTYPILAKKGNEIKKVRVKVAEDLDSKLKIGDKKYAESEDVIRVDIFKKENDDTLYFSPINNFIIAKEMQLNKLKKDLKKDINNKSINDKIEALGKDIKYTLWISQSDKRVVSAEKLGKEYFCVNSLYRYSLIELVKNDGSRGLCYSGGVTTGKLEIYSLLGDGTDLLYNNLVGSISSQYLATVSTIKEINVRKISVLGKVVQNEFSTCSN